MDILVTLGLTRLMAAGLACVLVVQTVVISMPTLAVLTLRLVSLNVTVTSAIQASFSF